jgi:hypothetical protein
MRGSCYPEGEPSSVAFGATFSQREKRGGGLLPLYLPRQIIGQREREKLRIVARRVDD